MGPRCAALGSPCPGRDYAAPRWPTATRCTGQQFARAGREAAGEQEAAVGEVETEEGPCPRRHSGSPCWARRAWERRPSCSASSTMTTVTGRRRAVTMGGHGPGAAQVRATGTWGARCICRPPCSMGTFMTCRSRTTLLSPASLAAHYRVLGTAEVPILIVGNKRDLQRGRVIPRHNVSDLVRKTWKCGYVECSAKFNWHVLLLFGEALRSVGCARCKHVHATIRFQRALRRERCALM
ncbi:uncharacterized protein LOC134453157 isoform X2 [Engraulis encrasicolus]|uniref:uncharacterized protein LOC134453157 isoform X2 n=1 Tax=Engraulis encrasicolus TaxID=184585 RepID=UPI002FCF1850